MIASEKFQLFLMAAFLLSISPGPGMLYVLARTVRGGRAEGVASTLGTAVGGGVHVVAAGLGLSAVLMTSVMAFTVLKYVGAAYLVFLGVKTLLAIRQPFTVEQALAGRTENPFYQGVLTEALNPKTAVFFLTFLPQFVVPDEHATMQFLLLGSISVAMNSLADLAVAFFAAPLARTMARNPRFRQGQQIFCGSALVSLGAYVALSDETKS
jgi:threonine/homoserine/homoserine lactone efflux protein